MLIGIVGKPSSGKSTFLNAACLTQYKTANYPFTTIKPNLGKSFVRTICACRELNIKDNPKNSICINQNRFIPVKLLDVAGLVPDAHLGKGMGNQFLSDLARADVLIHVIDISGSLDAEGQDIDEGARDPLDDIKFLEDEINFWFKDLIIKKDWGKFVRKIEQEKLSFVDLLHERLAGIGIQKEHILNAMNSINLDFEKLTKWNDDNIFDFARKLREISKPIIIAANKIDKHNGEQMLTELKRKYKGKIIPCSALAEYWLRKYAEDRIIEYLPGDTKFKIIQNEKLQKSELNALKNIEEKILKKYNSTGIQDIINYSVFNVLNQIVVYPVYDTNSFSDKDGNVLPDAHLVLKNTKLKKFVETKIHSDLAKNFIYGLDARSKMRLGEHYELKNNDIIKIVSAVKPK
ncbi:MAG: redox-regulated ATPase YchF [Candidatus Lokiarchaeota archaeon]|nr:redox-regulated ATPase YchF [Candidatus Harpocratesius repetitus]